MLVRFTAGHYRNSVRSNTLHIGIGRYRIWMAYSLSMSPEGPGEASRTLAVYTTTLAPALHWDGCTLCELTLEPFETRI